MAYQFVLKISKCRFHDRKGERCDHDNGEHINIDIEQFEELFHIDGLVPLAKGLFPGRHELLYHDDNGDKGTKGDDPLADAVHLDGLVCANHIVDHFHRLTSWLLISGLRSVL